MYLSLLPKERRGDFLGGTIQTVPHVTNEIKQKIIGLADDTQVDVVIVEVGGTVGDIEGVALFGGYPADTKRCRPG